MKHWLATLLVSAACVAAHATVVESYVSRLEIGADGTANATVTIQLKDVQAGRLILPVAFSAMDNFHVIDAAVGNRVIPLKVGELSALQLDLAGGSADTAALSVGFTVPGVIATPKVAAGKKPELPDGSALLSHAFVNTQPLPIQSYRVDVIFPEGRRAQLIREQLPKPKRSEVLPRVRLDAYDGRQGAQLQMSNLKQGDRTSMVIEVVEEQRSYGWLLVGLALVIAYLFGFSHLVRGEQQTSA